MDKKLNIPFLIAGSLLVVVVALFAIFYIQTTDKLNANTTKIASSSNQIVALLNQTSNLSGLMDSTTAKIAKDESTLSSLETKLTTANSQIVTLQNQLRETTLKAESAVSKTDALSSKYTSDIASLQNQNAQNTTTITGLNTKVLSDSVLITNLSEQMQTVKDQNTALNNLVTSLQGQVNSLSFQSRQVTLANSLAVTANIGQTQVTSFFAQNPGTLSVNGTSTSTTGRIVVNNITNGTTNSYFFGTGTSLSLAIQAGTNTIFFDNLDGVARSAVLSIIYSY